MKLVSRLMSLLCFLVFYGGGWLHAEPGTGSSDYISVQVPCTTANTDFSKISIDDPSVACYNVFLPQQVHEKSDIPETEDDTNEQTFLKKCIGDGDESACRYALTAWHKSWHRPEAIPPRDHSSILSSGRYIVFRAIRI